MAEEGVSILETESYILAIVFLVFLALFVTVEKAALDAVKSELMLFGVASLLLSALEGPITSICIAAPSSHRWTILSQLNGCECCLRRTKAISECYLDYAGCGANFCNCNNANPSCLAEAAPSSETAVVDCVGVTPYRTEQCGNRPGYKQALTSRAINQIHKMLFSIALSHIVCSVIMTKIATARIKIWKMWLSDDDAHSTAVNLTLQQFAEAEAALQQARASNNSRDQLHGKGKLPVWRSLAKSLSSSRRKAPPDVAGTTAAASDHLDARDGLAATLPSHTALDGAPPGGSLQQHDSSQAQASDKVEEDFKRRGDGGGVQEQNGQHEQNEQNGQIGQSEHNEQGPNGENEVGSQNPITTTRTPQDGGKAIAKPPAFSLARRSIEALTPGPGQLHHDVAHMLWHNTLARVSGTRATSEHGAGDGGSPRVAVPQTEVEACLANMAAHEAAEDAASGEHNDIALDIHLPDEVVVQHSRRWAGRKGQLDKRRQYSWEYAMCFLSQFRLQTIQHAEMSIMRASFILTHRPGRKFNFMDYILASLDDDCAKVVGLGWSVWLVVIVFVLLAGVMGWAAAWFELLAVILELVMNTQLIYIARHTARGGRVNRLKPTIFWFGAKGPWVMLLAIKTLLFLNSFIFASLTFFAVTFGARSCFFATPGLNTASLPIPWWVILAVNIVVYLALSFVTLPLYSLGVQMGSDFRPHILSPNIKNRLLDIAHANKEKVRQRKLEEGRVGKYKGKLRRLPARLSATGQRWRRKRLGTPST